MKASWLGGKIMLKHNPEMYSLVVSKATWKRMSVHQKIIFWWASFYVHLQIL
jgi:hypothetical protein